MVPEPKDPARSISRASRVRHGGRVAFGGGRLAGRESDFALRHGQPGKRIDHQQDVLAARTEIFGDGGGRESGADAEQRVLVGGGDDDDGAAAAFVAQSD